MNEFSPSILIEVLKFYNISYNQLHIFYENPNAMFWLSEQVRAFQKDLDTAKDFHDNVFANEIEANEVVNAETTCSNEEPHDIISCLKAHTPSQIKKAIFIKK